MSQHLPIRMGFREALRQTEYLHSSKQIGDSKYREWLAAITRWEADCEYEIVEYLPGQWEMKLVPLLQNRY